MGIWNVTIAMPSPQNAFVLIASALLFPFISASGRSCRCLFGQSCWPSASEFNQLASQVSQPLVHPVPPESACYPASSPSGNCSEVTANTFDGRWRSDQPGSMQAINWETYTFVNGTISACYLNASLGFPCEQGSVPVVGVDARSVQDIQAAVKFASKHNLRVVVKNTGHDFLGRSTARGSFLIWTHHLKNITYQQTFTPTGAPASTKFNDVITLGAGVQWYEAYDAVQAQGRMIVGGISARASVGAAGGWVAGGGHSALSPLHGMGVDNALQFTIVTANGKHITANAHDHADLYWALRGGGGGTYGVVTSVTYQTHPSVPVIGIFFNATFSSPETAKTVVTEFIRIQPSLANIEWGGYSSLANTTLQFLYIAPNTTWEAANATINLFFDFARSALESGGSPSPQAVTIPFDSFYSWYQLLFGQGEQVGVNTYLGSRLIPQALVESDHAKVAETLLSIDDGAAWYVVTGGAASRVNPSSTGLNPAWRRAVAHVVVGETWQEGQPTSAINALKDRLGVKVKQLEALAGRGSGAYFNEASPFETNPQVTFFGSHYRRLKEIKNSYDPKGLFIVANGVGSDDWDASLNCRR